MLKQKFDHSIAKDNIQMEIWEHAHQPGFMFQQYRDVDEDKITAYEALAILKNADGSPLANNIYFDRLRAMPADWQVKADKFLVPLAIKAASEKKRLPVAVNVHLATLCDSEFLRLIDDVICSTELKKSDVMFEIVEPHIPAREQVRCLEKLSSRLVGDEGYVLIIDDHDFETGEDRLKGLASVCDMVKIDMKDAKPGIEIIKNSYPHLSIVIERVTFNDRQKVFASYPGVLTQGI